MYVSVYVRLLLPFKYKIILYFCILYDVMFYFIGNGIAINYTSHH